MVERQKVVVVGAGPVRAGLIAFMVTLLVTGCAAPGPDTEVPDAGRVATVVDLETGAVLGAAAAELRRDRRQRQLLLDGYQLLEADDVPAYLDRQVEALERLLDGTPVRVSRSDGVVRIVLPADDLFGQDTTIRPVYERLLADIATAMDEFDQHLVEVAGHASGDGAASVSQRLSESRARTVGRLLTAKDLADSRLLIAAFGADGDGGEGVSPDRVELVLVPLVKDE